LPVTFIEPALTAPVVLNDAALIAPVAFTVIELKMAF
jgi:hypothetical protein